MYVRRVPSRRLLYTRRLASISTTQTTEKEAPPQAEWLLMSVSGRSHETLQKLERHESKHPPTTRALPCLAMDLGMMQTHLAKLAWVGVFFGS